MELKAGVIRTPHNEGISFDRDSSHIAVTEDETEFYIKSEADEVIRRQKYKRCLAMALYCEELMREAFLRNPEYIEWLDKWRERWLKIAEKFKEAK